MKLDQRILAVTAAGIFLAATFTFGQTQTGSLMVRAYLKKPAQGDGKDYPTRIVSSLRGLEKKKVLLDEYGGLAETTEKATGFFYVKKNGPRWWLVDPLGHDYLGAGMVNVGMPHS